VNALLFLPIVVPLATAAAGLVAWRLPRFQAVLSILGAVALLASGLLLLFVVSRRGIMASVVGAWPPPFGISFVADLFAAIMVVLAGIVGLAVTVYSTVAIDDRRKSLSYYALVHVLLAGVCGAFLTGDIFNLYVWFEVMLISSFVLLALGGERRELEGAIKYVTLNLISSALFLAAVGLLYGLTGALNLADLHLKLAAVPRPTFVTATALLLLVAFGIKAAVFPLFFWLPASYHTPPAAISALFAGLLTKVGVYALIRVFTLLFTAETAYTHELILWISALTMLTGVLGAAAQDEFRRILSFHIVSQIGYMLMGLGLLTPAALSGSLFYIAHHIIVKTNLFLVSGVVGDVGGSVQLARLGGFYRAHIVISLLFLIPALSLAGVPPLSGFFAKLALTIAGVEQGRYVVVAVALVVGLLTLYSMTKIWGEVFWKPQPSAARKLLPLGYGTERRLALFAPMVALAVLTLGLGFWPDSLFRLTGAAARQLLEPSQYVRAVLEARP
jgi:multicomponent Na+:H+ antiporter subunit D